MKNAYEVLRQKELEVSRVKKEVEALRVAAPLLSDGEEMAYEATASLSKSSSQNSSSEPDQAAGREKKWRLP
jgi:hypothetical protein